MKVHKSKLHSYRIIKVTYNNDSCGYKLQTKKGVGIFGWWVDLLFRGDKLAEIMEYMKSHIEADNLVWASEIKSEKVYNLKKYLIFK